MKSSNRENSFLTTEQASYIANLERQRYPAFIVAVCYANTGGPWQFTTAQGTVLAKPHQHRQGIWDEMTEQAAKAPGLCWGFVTKSQGLMLHFRPCFDRTGDYTQSTADFERWLIEHDIPFERIDAPAPDKLKAGDE